MSWTVTNIETHFRTTNATSYHSPDATTTNLTAGKLYLLFVESRLVGTPNVPTISGTTGSWNQEATLLFFGAASGDTRLTLFSYVPASNESAVQLTVDFAAQTQTHCSRGLYELAGEDANNWPSPGPVLNVATGTLDAGTGTSVSATISGADNADAMVAYAVHYAVNEDVTPTSPYVEMGQSAGGGTAGDATTVEAQYDTGGTDTVTASWATASRGAIMVAQIKHAAANTDLSGGATAGSYAVTGADATTIAATNDTPITASPGSYAVTGSPVVTTKLKIVTVKPGGGGTYTSLNSALTTEAGNLVTLGYILQIECYGGTADTTTASIAGFTTDANHYVYIKAAAGEGHQGHWDATKYTLHVTDGHCVSVNCVDLLVEGLQLLVEKQASSSTHRGVFVSSTLSGTLNVTFLNCIARAEYTGSPGGVKGAAIGFSGPSNASAAGYFRYINCIAHDFYIDPTVNGSTFGFTQSATPTGLTVLWYNCLAVRCYRGFNGTATVKAKNCLALECHNQNAWAGTFHEDTTNNASAGPTGETKGANPLDIAAAVFYDPLADDFRLHPGDDSGLRTWGADLSADVDYPFNTDIVGHTRAAGSWVVGPYDPTSDTFVQDIRWAIVSAPTSEGATVKARMIGIEASPILYLVVSENSDLSSPVATVGPVDATTANDYIATFFVSGLNAGTLYHYGVKRDTGGTPYTRFRGQFRTAPAGADNIKIAIWGDEDSGATDPAATAEIEAYAPDLIICLGDYHYSDIASAAEADYANAFEAQNELSRNMRLLKIAPLIYTWSDHDFQGSNSDGRYVNKSKVQAVYRRFFATPSLPATSAIYYSTVYGRLRIIVPDLRSERNAPTLGRIMSATQMAWLKSELDASMAGGQIPVIVSECEWGGAAGANNESWTGYTTDRTELSDYLEAHSIQAIILTADAHMIAIDSGANMDYSTDGLMTKPPIVMSCAPLEQNGTAGLGTYDQGSGVYEGDNEHGHGQYSTLTITDSGGTTLGAVLDGWQGTTGLLVSYSPTLTPPASMDLSPGAYAVTGVDLYTHKEEYEYPLPGQYAIEGVDVELLRTLLMDVDAGGYAITGVDADLAEHRIFDLTASAGLYDVTGADATIEWVKALDTEAGAYDVTGADATTLWDHDTSATAGAYGVTGQAAALTKQFFLSGDATAGAYAITGAAITETITRALAATAGAYAVTGAPQFYLTGRVFAVDPGSYAVTGQATTQFWGHLESTSPGAYAVTGSLITESRSVVATLAAGGYAITGVAAALLRSHIETLGAGAYAVSGAATTTLWGHAVPAGAGAYTVNGASAATTRALLASVSAGVVAVTGADAVTTYIAQFSLAADPGTYAIIGDAAATTRGLLEAASSGTYAVTGSPTTQLVDTPHIAAAGAYAVAGQPATTTRGLLETASSGAYTVTGAAALTEKLSVFAIDAGAGAYTVTGAAAVSLHAREHASAAGAYAITGADTATTAGWITIATAGAYVVSGSVAFTAKTGTVLSAPAGVYNVTGASATTATSTVIVLVADPGSLTVTGFDVTTSRGFYATVDAGAYAITGAALAGLHDYVTGVLAGSYAITGRNLAFLYHVVEYPRIQYQLPLSTMTITIVDAPTRKAFAVELE